MGIMLAPAGAGITAFGGGEGGSFDEIGCFAGCHSGMVNQPYAPTADTITSHPYFGDDGLGEDEILHYLLDTRHEGDRRNPDGAWASIDGTYSSEASLAAGNFLDLLQFRAARSAPMYGASNDYILQFRMSGKGGRNYWFSNSPASQGDDADELTYDEAAHVWRDAEGAAISFSAYSWMYDESKTGFHALPAEALDSSTGDFTLAWSEVAPLIIQGPERNAVPLDQSVIEEGDFLPRRLLQYGTETRGRTNTFSMWQPHTQTWDVTFRRPLSGSASDLDLSSILDGGTITMAFGVFDDHSVNRYHHVSFPVSVGTAEGVDVRAVDNR
ncbi:MAG: ethylbenzene dehydrogenase-related protein [Bradymonadaceae bacterium]